MTDTEAAVKDTMRMTGCGSCGMYMILEGVPEKSFVCMKCSLIELMEEKIRGLEMQVESLVEFRRGFEQLMEHRHEGVEGISSDVQMEAGPKNSEERLLGEESGRWKHVTKRTRQRKRRASEGELELRNRFAELENEEGAQQVAAEGERERKKRRADSPARGEEESMEATPNMSPRRIARGNRNREDLQPVGAGDRPENHTVTRKRQVYVIGDSLLRRIDRPVTRADRGNRRVCYLPGAKIQDVDLRLKRILAGAGKNLLIVLHVGTNDMARYSLECIKGDYARLRKTLKEIEAQVQWTRCMDARPRTFDSPADWESLRRTTGES
ncbi:uncharacterized protein LOC127045235 isoform X2 [Gopherus flavomarginatus]|uniref:uncharacterized protein LOC127045235 isoform X2 n=1 Tax=Gopherus flavomarginatus TaxID=286002 RepID=UPI0021CBD284|nr:uncharacterized protein LOC127045235 isoform X2 [Gopherus flavomarginatus]